MRSLDKTVARRISKKIRFFCSTDDPMRNAKALKGSLSGVYRFRVGDWRVLFRKTVDGTIILLIILSVKHRNEVYE